MIIDIEAIKAAAKAQLVTHERAQEKLKETTTVPLLPTIPATVPVPLITIPAGLSAPPVVRFPIKQEV